MESWLNLSLFIWTSPLLLALYALERNPRSPRNLYFAGLAFTAAVLGLGCYLAYYASTPDRAYLAGQATRSVFVFLPAFYLAFSLHFGDTSPHIRRPLIIAAFLCSAVFCVLNLGGWMVPGFVRDGELYKPIIGPVYLAFFVFLTAAGLASLASFWRLHQRSGRYQRNRIRVLVLGLTAGICVGAASIPFLHRIQTPLAPWALAISTPLIAASFLKHRLLGAASYVRITVAGLLLLAALLVPLFAATVLLLRQQGLVLRPLELLVLLGSHVALTLLVLSVGRRIRWGRVLRGLQGSDRVDRDRLLDGAADLVREGAVDDVADGVAGLLDQATSAARILVFVGDRQEQGFTLRGARRALPSAPDRLPLDHPALSWLASRESALMHQDLSASPRGGGRGDVTEWMNEQGVELSVPVPVSPGTTSVLLLGPPAGDDIYQPADLAALDELASSVAAAFLSARAFESRQIDRQIAEVSRTVAGVAHEFRNSLIPARTFLELLPERRDDESFVDEYRSLALEQLRRSFRIIEQLKKLHVGAPVRRRAVRFDELVQRVCAGTAPLAQRGGTRVEVVVEHEPVQVDADPDQLSQALLNLLLNAIDHAGEAPVTVLLRRDLGDRGTGPPRAVVEVHNALSIPDDALPNVFLPFFTTRDTGDAASVGLGLPIARKILHDHGGTLSVRSRPREGTTFVLVLPEG